MIQLGESNRHYGETLMNGKSSRSHVLFRLVIESRQVLQGKERTQAPRRRCLPSSMRELRVLREVAPSVVPYAW